MFTTMFTTRRATTTLICATLLVSVSAVSGAADAAAPRHHHHVVSRVDGHTYVLLGPSVFGVTVQQDPLEYTAEGRDDGSVRGRWRYDYFEAGVETTFSGSVTCLTVRGNRAWIGGPITASSDPSMIGQGAWWQVADNGTGRHPVVPDRTTFAGIGTIAQTQAYCADAPEPHFIFDVQQGSVRVGMPDDEQ